MPLTPGHYLPCVCGEKMVRKNTAEMINFTVHRLDGPCYHLSDPTIKESTKMEFTTYVRKPFTVQAVEITKENIEEVAKYVGDLRYKDEDGTPYILVDRRLVPNVAKVYVGFFMTKMGENVRCYSRKIFREQFVENNDTIQVWVDYINGDPNAFDKPEPIGAPG